MASTNEYLQYVLDILRNVPGVTYRKMMGEYLLYSEGVLFGGIYDDRLLLKDVPAARMVFPAEEIPYDGAKPMLLVDSEDLMLVTTVIESMIPELPRPKQKR